MTHANGRIIGVVTNGEVDIIKIKNTTELQRDCASDSIINFVRDINCRFPQDEIHYLILCRK